MPAGRDLVTNIQKEQGQVNICTSGRQISCLPAEIWSQIFKIGCDTEFDDKNSSTSLLVHQLARRSSQRRLKPFARTVSQVCNYWRDHVKSTPSFWITTISLHVSSQRSFLLQTAQLEELLEASNGSEIDFWIKPRKVFPMYVRTLKFEDVEEWLRNKLFLPYQQRIRAFFVEGITQEFGTMLMRLLGQGRWNTLRAIALRACDPDCVLPLQRLSFPALHYLEIQEMSWDSIDCPIDMCSSFNFIRGRRKGGDDPTTWLSLMPYLHKLSRQLTCLKINTISASLASLDSLVDKGATIELPSLEKLSISTTFYEEVVFCLNLIRVHHLSELRINTFLQSSSETEYTNRSLFKNLSRLTLGVPTDCLLPLLRDTPVDNIADVALCCVRPKQFSESDTSSPIRFKTLRNLLIDCSNDFPINIFDFSNVTEYVRLVCHPTLTQKLFFPDLRKLDIGFVQGIELVRAPSLVSLQLPLQFLVRPFSKEWKSFGEESLRHVETLQLSGCAFSSVDLDFTIFQYLPRLRSMVLKNVENSSFHTPSASYALPFPSIGSAPVAYQNITELTLSFAKLGAKDTTDIVDGVAGEVKKLVQSKKIVGFPLRTLRFSGYLPSPDLMEWFTKELDCFHVICCENEFGWLDAGR